MGNRKNHIYTMLGLTLLSPILMSIPFIIPHCGLISLFAIVPLLLMERIASKNNIKRVWVWHYSAFVLWNTLTTFWVCNATIGGGIFAILANALQMSIIFGTFRLSKKVFNGTLPYIFLAAMWITWERAYFYAQISWPWLVLGNSFARTVSVIQWYEFTGSLGGSLWIWAVNLSVFGIICTILEGNFIKFNIKAKAAIIICTVLLIGCPILLSERMYNNYKEHKNPLEVLIVQPNIDPYHKFTALSQEEQNQILINLAEAKLKDTSDTPLLIIAPETFTNDIVTNDIGAGLSYRTFQKFIERHPNTNLLFGASSYTYSFSNAAPSYNARKVEDGVWVESHNSAIITDATGRADIFHKSKLVVGVEMTPYPAFFTKIDNLLGNVMGRCIGQKEISTLDFISYNKDSSIKCRIPIGCAICYESVYGEYCTGYIRKGAKALAVITNDAWWGNTPGYRQHLSYSSLRAIETRRDIARCANTGISAIINQRGDIVKKTSWWKTDTLAGKINLNNKITFFVKNGDIIGRISSFIFILLLLSMAIKLYTNRQTNS